MKRTKFPANSRHNNKTARRQRARRTFQTPPVGPSILDLFFGALPIYKPNVALESRLSRSVKDHQG